MKRASSIAFPTRADMSRIGAVLLGIGRGLDILRRFLHLLLLLAIFGFLFGLWKVSVPLVPAKAALVIAPEGQIVEQLSGDPIERAIAEARGTERAETLLWDMTDSIRAAAKDARIGVLVLDLDDLSAAGQPTLEELAKAIREFRASGKKVISYGTAYVQDQYYLAAQANEIYVDPLGLVLIDGYDAYRWYYKELLEKIGLNINVFRVGAYKSAVEEFTRTDMSPEAREETLAYLNALWTNYQKATTTARKLKPDAVASYV